MKERIKQIRNSKEMNQTDFAKELLISRSALCKLESGENMPSAQTIGLICSKFNVDEEWLRTGQGEMYKARTQNQQIIEFANNIMECEDTEFKKKFIQAISKLDVRDWETLEKIALDLQEKEKQKED